MKKNNLKDEQVQDSQNQGQLRLRAKLIWHSVSKGKVSFIEMHLVLLFSYLQICFLTTRFIRKFGIEDFSPLSKGFKYVENMLTLDNFFGYSVQDGGLIAAFSVIFAYFVIAVTTPILLIKSIRAYIPPNGLVTSMWGILIRFHNPIIFLLIHDITGRVQDEYSQDNLKTFNSNALNQAIFIFSVLFSILNLLLSVLRTTFLHDYIPKKNLMSCKNSYTDQISLLQKAIIPILHRFFLVTPLSTVLIITINTILCLIKVYKYYATYPRYNIKALYFNAYMVTIEASFVLFTPILFILNAFETIEIPISSALIMIIMILPFLLFLTHQTLRKGLRTIIYSPPNELNPHKLIHRLILLKQMKSQKNKYDEVSGSMNINRLLFASLATQIGSAFGETDAELISMDFNDKEVQNKIIRHFLERLEEAHPHDYLIKLSLIKFYSKTLKLFSLAIINLSNLNSFSPRMKVSKDLLYLEIQETIATYYKGNNDSINLADYLTNMNRIEDFKLKINIQLNLQKQFWTEYNKTNPNSFTLYQLSKRISLQKEIVHSHWNRADFNKEYSQPFLLYASYLLVLNDSLHEGLRYIKSYNLFNPKVKENLDADYVGLESGNLYSDETFYITIKTDGDNVGIIQKCSASIKKRLHYDSKAMVGTNINVLMSDYLASTHDDLLIKYVQTGKTKILNYIRSIFVKDKYGFLHRASIFSKVHPFFTQDLLLTGLIRPLKSHEEYMIITPQGIIDSTSCDIGTVLDIVGKKIAMTSICKEFEEVNQIFNFFGYRQIKPHAQGGLNYGAISLKFKDKVDEEIDPRMEALYNKWVIDGGELKFSIPTSSKTHKKKKVNNYITFWCKIHNYWYANDFLKILVIERANHLENEYHQLIETSNNSPGLTFLKKQIDHSKDARKKSYDFSDMDEIEEYKKHVKFQLIQTTEATPPARRDSAPTKGLKQQVEGATFSRRVKGIQSNVSLESCRDDFALLKGLLSPKDSVASNHWLKKQDSHRTDSSSRAVQIDFRPRPVSVSSTSQATTVAREGRLHNEIISALKIRTFPPNSIAFIGICFCLSIMVFVSQVYTGQKIRDDLDNLQYLGETIDLANTAVDALLIINRGTRMNLEKALGLVDTANDPLADLYMQSYEGILLEYLPILKDTNNQLWGAVQKIDAKFRNVILEENIKFYDYNRSLLIEGESRVNTINGLKSLLNRLYHLQKRYLETGDYRRSDLLYIMRNGCGDLLVENKQLVEMGNAFLSSSIDSQHKMLNIFLAISLCLLAVKLFTAAYFCYKFYILELAKMRFFLRIKDHELKWINERLNHLEGALKEEDYQEIIHAQGHNRMDPKLKGMGTFVKQKGDAKRTFKEPNMKDTLRRYIVKIISWVVILVTYAALTGAVHSVMYNQGSKFEEGLSRLISLQSFMENTQLATIGFYALFLPEYDPTIENIPILTALNTNLEVLTKSTQVLTNAYKKSDGTLDPDILPIFTGNACSYVPEDDLPMCLFVASGLDSVNIFSLISALHSRLRFFTDQFLLSDQSFEEAKRICTDGFVDMTPFSMSTREVLIFMITEARKNFHSTYSSLAGKLTACLTVKIIVFWFLFALSWKYVMKFLLDCPNRIKSIMTVVPIHIMVSNKSLKALLMKTCKGNNTILKADLG